MIDSAEGEVILRKNLERYLKEHLGFEFKMLNKKAHLAEWTSKGLLVNISSFIIPNYLIKDNGGFTHGKTNNSIFQ